MEPRLITIEGAKKILELFDFAEFEDMVLVFTSSNKVTIDENHFINTKSKHRVISKNPSMNDLDIKFNELECTLEIIEVYYKNTIKGSIKHFTLDLAQRYITFYEFHDVPITMKQITDKLGSYFYQINSHY